MSDNGKPMRRGKPSPPQKSNGWEAESGSKPSQNGDTENGDTAKSPSKPLPGRPRRRKPVAPLTTTKKKKKASFWKRFHARWIDGYSKLILAVLLWYSLGVVSIGTSKLLLMDPIHHHGHVGNVPPLFLTLQQLFLGSNLLRSLLKVQAFGTAGMQPFPSKPPSTASHRSRKSKPRAFWKAPRTDLIMAGIFFAMGFLTTNLSFRRSAASYVETIKAAEPITSAMVAVLWGIETLSTPEVTSLAAIVTGVLLSTIGNSSGESPGIAMSLGESIRTMALIMICNLCFSFRGLHQKLFRASSQGSAAQVDDLNLQFRMQQIGVYVLILPVLVLNVPGMITSVWELSRTVGLIRSGILLRYASLALVNGMAFTCYNLASTYILTRISVVHHAALNCIRRVFAIIVTSFLFGVPITPTGAFGILVSVCGFLSFTHYKAKRLRQPKPVSSLLPVSEHNKDLEG